VEEVLAVEDEVAVELVGFEVEEVRVDLVLVVVLLLVVVVFFLDLLVAMAVGGVSGSKFVGKNFSFTWENKCNYQGQKMVRNLAG
jgi:type IV secretory pathway TrbL component